MSELPTLSTADNTPATPRTERWRALGWLVAAGVGVKRGIIWTWTEIAYWFNLLFYTARRQLRLEALLTLAAAFIFFGYIVSSDRIHSQRDLLEYCYLFFTAMMIFLAAGLLPRERDERTLEILWSQPMPRGVLITAQLLVLTAWCALLCAGVIFYFSNFTAYTEHRWTTLTCVATSSFSVGAVTILFSTFSRHFLGAALLSILVLGVHFFWIRTLGPIEFFINPIPEPGASAARSGNQPSLLVNRIFLLALTGFVLDYLFRRLKRTAPWFT